MQRTRAFSPTKYLSQTDRDIAAVKRERDELDRLLQGLEAARNAMSGHILTRATSPRANGNGSRATAIKEILESWQEPVNVDLIMKELHKRNLNAQRGSVAAGLSYLKRQGHATNISRGKWTTTPHSQAA